MKIGFEAKFLTGRRTGGDYYFLHLLEALLKNENCNTYKAYTRIPFDIHHPRLEEKKAIIPGRLLNQLWKYFNICPMETLIGDIDIYHSPYPYMPYVKKAKRIITVHDLSFLRIPDIFEKSIYEWNMHSVSYMKKADYLIAVSQQTKNDIVELCDVNPEKISVVYNGIDHNAFIPVDQVVCTQFLKNKNIVSPFFLYVGTIEPRKNLIELLNAFNKFYLSVDKEVKLVLIGKKGWLYDDVFATYESLPSKNNIHFLGYVPIDELKYYYSACIAFVYPSLYEGFGLPNIEAMACGAPVITSNNSCIPEIVGDAAVLVDPRSTDELFGALRAIYTDPDLRRSLIKRGLAKSQSYSWMSCAKDTLGIYKQICS